MNKRPRFKSKNFLASFRYAFMGILTAFQEERNMKSHVASLFVAIGLGIYYSLSLSEWLWILLVIHLVITIEIINTAIENIVDFVSMEYNNDAKKIKDMSAAAVLMIAFFAAIVGSVIFLPKIFN